MASSSDTDGPVLQHCLAEAYRHSRRLPVVRSPHQTVLSGVFTRDCSTNAMNLWIGYRGLQTQHIAELNTQRWMPLHKVYSVMETIWELSDGESCIHPQPPLGPAEEDHLLRAVGKERSAVYDSSASGASLQILPSFMANPFFSSLGANRRIWLSLSPFFFARLCGVSVKRILAI